MPPVGWEWIVALLGAGGLGKAAFDWLTGRRRSKADVADRITDAAGRLVGVQDDVIERLQQQVHALGLQVDHLRRENDRLIAESVELRELVARLERTISQLRPPDPV